MDALLPQGTRREGIMPEGEDDHVERALERDGKAIDTHGIAKDAGAGRQAGLNCGGKIIVVEQDQDPPAGQPIQPIRKDGPVAGDREGARFP